MNEKKLMFFKDVNGWLWWNKWIFTNKVYCPFSKKMQCNVNCPLFERVDDTVRFSCTGAITVVYRDVNIVAK